MFTEEEINKLRSCWVLPDGSIEEVPSEQHDDYLPDGYETVLEAEKKCFRMSFGWGWDAPISQMTISSNCELTEKQKQVIKYLLMAKIITHRQIEYYGDREEFYALLTEVENELKQNK